ncbi:MAG TPA: alpha/beta hydrolase [Casimicrobiaceae bacterium]|nr:alpha/beta hydrolase [Casimicrobiaceae bacterium]
MAQRLAGVKRDATPMSSVSFVDIAHDGRQVALEYRWIEPSRRERDHKRSAPLVVFLHEGLGSVAMWKDYPQRLCDAGGFRGLVFSREGYGRSTPRRHHERWPVDFMHAQARDVLPRLFGKLGVGARGQQPWLLGHSDGGSIALIYAATFPERVAGVVALAPHIFVEDMSIESIAAARTTYLAGDLRDRLGRYHADVDSAFFGWNDVWLDPAFRGWSIEAMVAKVRCALLVVQGANDEYGTLAQVEGIRARARHAKIVVLANCGHSPQRDQPEALTRTVTDFIARRSDGAANGGGMS